MPSPTEPIVDIKNACVYRKDTCVFDSLSLSINQHQPTAILGPNGAGKTTLLKLLTREIYPVVNENSFIKLFGDKTVNLWQLRQKIGLVSHEFQAEHSTLASGLEIVLSAFFGSTGIHGHHEVSSAQRKQALSVMTQLRLAELKDKSFLKLSTGQQRRLLLARAVVHKPLALILDEPTAGLDIAAAFQLIKDMRQWCQQGRSLILVTHHIHEIIPEIERVIFIKNGAVIADGEKCRLLTDKRLSALYDTELNVSETAGFYSIRPA